MGLIHPENLELWQEWERSRHRARRAKHAVTDAAHRLRTRGRSTAGASPEAPAWTLHSREADPEAPEGTGRLLIAVDSASPTSRASLLASLPYLRAGIDVLAPAGLDLPELTAEGSRWGSAVITDPVADLDAGRLGAVMSIGQHLGAGAAAHEIARRDDLPEVVVQHGALTPYAPPLPEGALLLAWSEADGDFWLSGREDVATRTVGSQLLWQAGHETATLTPDAAPVFLGQMHGTELPRALSAGTAYRFCRAEHARYRPHPSEKDVASRAVPPPFRARGIEIDESGAPLADIGAPVVAIFSTGVLEAAARGIPSYVHCPRAPGWVHEFWDRYDMNPWEAAEPTPAPERSAEEPAAAIARVLEGEL